MSTKRCRIMALLIVTALVLSSPAILLAASYNKGAKEAKTPSEKMEARHEELYKDLNLTEAQKKALEENKQARREEMKSLFSQMKEKREAIRTELQKNELNIGKITQINNELKILSAQMLDRRLEGILEVRKILTPEQFKKFMAKMGGRGKSVLERREIDKKVIETDN